MRGSFLSCNAAADAIDAVSALALNANISLRRLIT
jgi:hypothetical protein